VEEGQPRLGTGLQHAVDEDAGLDLERRMGEMWPAHLEVVEARAAETAQFLRSLVKGSQLVPPDRPAAAGDPVARREVLLIQRAAVPEPVVGAAAHVPEGLGVEHEARRRPGRDAVDAVVAVAVRDAASLQQQYAHRSADQVQRDGEPGGAGPHDAEIGRHGGRLRARSKVDEHAMARFRSLIVLRGVGARQGESLESRSA
jgi:hypothetical protein